MWNDTLACVLYLAFMAVVLVTAILTTYVL